MIILTIIIAFIITLIAVGLLAISWLLTGKSKIKLGSCGRDPTNKDENCAENKGISCILCKRKDKTDERLQ